MWPGTPTVQVAVGEAGCRRVADLDACCSPRKNKKDLTGFGRFAREKSRRAPIRRLRRHVAAHERREQGIGRRALRRPVFARLVASQEAVFADGKKGLHVDEPETSCAADALNA